LENVKCGGCLTKKALLKTSKVLNSYLVFKENETTRIVDSTIRSVFSRSDIKRLDIENTTFLQEKVSNIAHIKSDLVYIRDSTLNTDFYESQIKKVVMENVRGSFAGFKRLEGESVSIADSMIDLVNIGTINKPLKLFESTNSSYKKRLVFLGIGFDEIKLSGSSFQTGVRFTEANATHVSMKDIDLSSYSFLKSTIDTFQLTNSRIELYDGYLDGWWFNSSIRHLEMDNVYMNGLFRIEQSTVNHLTTKNLKKGAAFKATYEDANFEF
jgi:uncharacterized protein YjbI with pentapeptide repeats